MRGCYGDWATVLFGHFGWDFTLMSVFLCVSPWAVCALFCKDVISLSDEANMHFMCASAHHVRSHLTSLRLENSRPGISSAGSHSTYALVPLNFPLSHSHTSSTNAQLTSIWQQGWSAFKWCFVKLDEVDVGVVADSPFLGFKKLNVL